MKRTPGIYALIDPRTDGPFYVGKSVHMEKRAHNHKLAYRVAACNPDERAVHLELQSLGLSCIPIFLEVVNNPLAKADPLNSHWDTRLNHSRLCDAEIWWIAYLRGCGWKLTNKQPGGSNGNPGRALSEETRAKLRANNAMKNPLYRAKVSIGKRGKKRPDMAGEFAIMLRPGVKAKSSAVLTGRKLSKGHIQKISDRLKGGAYAKEKHPRWKILDVAYLRAQRERGVPWKTLAASLGVCVTTIYKRLK